VQPLDVRLARGDLGLIHVGGRAVACDFADAVPESLVGVFHIGLGRRRGGCAAPSHLLSCVRWLQQCRHRAADDDLAADHLGALDVEIAEFSADEIKCPLV
jgi:hypothetical protein